MTQTPSSTSTTIAAGAPSTDGPQIPKGTGVLAVAGNILVRDGEPHQIISGAVHYFRIPRPLWRDRLQRLAAMGCSTVETYVAWNFHQPHRDSRPDFSGDRDLGAFLDAAAGLDLDVIVRPGPYICAEWDFGGLPSWLLDDPQASAALRTSDPAYLDHVDAWFDHLVPIIARRQASRGGRVVAVQVENEYGSYGNDRHYLEHLRDGLLERGIDVPLFTSDGPGQLWLQGGTLDDCLATVNFGSRQQEAFAALEAFRPGQPGICMEFWNGWFDHWGAGHTTRDPEDAAAELAGMLADGRSVNFYLAHGGTNFGVWAGANTGEPGPNGPAYLPTVTSYDYDAPIGEDGRLTPKFWAFRDVIAAHTSRRPPEPPADPPRLAAAVITIDRSIPLASVLDHQPVTVSPTPQSFEALGLHHGVVRYRTRVHGPFESAALHLDGLADLASVSVNQTTSARVGRTTVDPAYAEGCTVTLAEDNVLDLTVHSLGRVNFGPRLRDPKGLSAVRLEFQHLFGWEQSALDLTELPHLDWSGPQADQDQQAFHRGAIMIDEPADGYLDLTGWHHGYVFLNGFNLGRYWPAAGPQRTLYAPAPLWRQGRNDLVLLELVAAGTTVALVDRPVLG
ncbi:beta-galactosidase [Microlunatus panaciterrae]|uniref:Beta-galactosidase n=1 Tax=Microlunatus panaciterrae TaxID=400768 RepID=A0ABS2RGG0_9ACTN|nr:beta-galactosidase family protein [Microlunatus panaciterrae]MBM7798081.1 beta-galactosidase [Microlunatus panaciterrae]